MANETDLDALCINCGHAYKFHLQLNGEPRSCDHEGDNGDPDPEYSLELCECPAFVPQEKNDAARA